MITKIQGYQSSDGTVHSTLESAQQFELLKIFQSEVGDECDANGLALTILSHSDKIIDILTMKPNSLPKARKINGGTKKRTPKHIADQNVLPLEAK